ncbi:hypothetical protein ACFFQW_41315 [Umezawaea endophytica]|uniref:Uncharacterized protein n=1 Tax=Umezawaea endophytica TaxID=1654476 RepID=A0A9X2VK72_9PSEU|nr:hypothetical protein [Umezawaea endophytica]MCS7477919.1 hypothetical protein [Umezawaea endophytica]
MIIGTRISGGRVRGQPDDLVSTSTSPLSEILIAVQAGVAPPCSRSGDSCADRPTRRLVRCGR